MTTKSVRMNRAITETLESRVLLADAILVKDIFTGADSGVFFSKDTGDVAVVGGKMFFTGIDPSLGQQPFVSDGMGPGTKRVPGAGIIEPGGDARQSDYVAGNGKAYFVAKDGTGLNIWSSDGTDANTKRLTNLAGTLDSTGINYLTFVNGTLFFNAASALYKTSDAGGHALVSSAAFPSDKHLAVGNSVFYTANSAAGTELWTADASGAHLVSDIRPGADSSAPDNFVAFNGNLYFTAHNASGARQVYRSDGSTASLVGSTFTADAFPFALTVSGGKLYFLAKDAGGYQIWRSDGTGTARVTTLANTSDFNAIRDLTDVNGTLYFTYSNAGATRLLHKLVGDTPTRVDTETGGANGGTSPGFLTSVGNGLYFSALDTNGTAKLFKTDGTTITLATGAIGTDPAGLTNVNGKLFFRAFDATHGDELRALADDTQPPPPPPNNDPFTARIKIHPNAKGNTSVIDEGESLTFQAVTTGPEIEKIYWDFGDGKLTYLGKARKPTHEYLDNFATPTVNVRIKVKPVGQDKFFNATVPITVNNVAPANLKLTMPGAFVTMAPMPFFGSVNDPADAKNGTLKIHIDWDDGETSDLTTQPDGSFGGVKVWGERQLLQGRQVRVTANDGTAPEITKKHTVRIDWFLDTTQDVASTILGFSGVLMGGTNGNDRIQVKRSTENAEALVMILHESVAEFFPSDDPIYMYAGGGNDRLEIDPGINVRTRMYGGSGNDTLRGGDARDTLYGQGGSDSLDGRGGKDTEKQ